MAEQSQEGTNRTQRICSITSSSKKGHFDSSKIHKPLLQSNKLHFWVSWGFMMVWLVMVRKVSKKSASVRKMTVHWKLSVLKKCAYLNKSASKTHQFSAFSLLCSSIQLLRCSLKDSSQLRSPGLLNFWYLCLPELLHIFYAQEISFLEQWEELIGQGYLSCCCSSEPWGWAPEYPASHHPEWSTRNSVFHSSAWLLVRH